MSSGSIVVLEDGRELSFAFGEMLKYHGGNSPGGVAHAFKVLERALPLLESDGRVERREVLIETAFGGPGARDALELVTRAVTDSRLVVDRSLARPELGRARERFVFRLRYRDRAVTLVLRDGFVTDEFIDLARRERLSYDEQRTLAVMKSHMANRVMAAGAGDVYALAPDPA